jgi:hypothetical protein
MTIRKDHKRKILKFRCFYRINFPSNTSSPLELELDDEEEDELPLSHAT